MEERLWRESQTLNLLENKQPDPQHQAFRQLKNDKEVFGHLTQLHTMHSYNTYSHCFNLPNQSQDCDRGDATPPNPEAVREHILYLCPLYAKEHRDALTPVSRLHETMTLLGSEKGLLAMAKFLKTFRALTSGGKQDPSISLLMLLINVDKKTP